MIRCMRLERKCEHLRFGVHIKHPYHACIKRISTVTHTSTYTHWGLATGSCVSVKRRLSAFSSFQCSVCLIARVCELQLATTSWLVKFNVKLKVKTPKNLLSTIFTYITLKRQIPLDSVWHGANFTEIHWTKTSNWSEFFRFFIFSCFAKSH